MGKTYRRNQGYRPKSGGKDFKRFKKSNKFKKWEEKSSHSVTTVNEPDVENVDISELTE